MQRQRYVLHESAWPWEIILTPLELILQTSRSVIVRESHCPTSTALRVHYTMCTPSYSNRHDISLPFRVVPAWQEAKSTCISFYFTWSYAPLSFESISAPNSGCIIIIVDCQYCLFFRRGETDMFHFTTFVYAHVRNLKVTYMHMVWSWN